VTEPLRLTCKIRSGVRVVQGLVFLISLITPSSNNREKGLPDVRPPWSTFQASRSVVGSSASSMPRKECNFKRCSCKSGLREVTAAEETFCQCLIKVQFGWEGFARKPDGAGGVFKVKTWLCEEHYPDGLEAAAMLGSRVARVIGGELLYGEVTHVAGFGRDTSSRVMEQRVERLLEQPPHEWKYTVTWPGATSLMAAHEVEAAVELASAVDARLKAEQRKAEERRQRDVHAALQRGQRAGLVTSMAPRVRCVLPTYNGLLSRACGRRRVSASSERYARCMAAVCSE
jgi:hypothetical protein